ncbi:MAG: pantoate--beta-alanine ligase, partial [Muribaculaceae bacterium]|nr:pantoate--beta-alanine ligase [Muribaculaceae bacterium]
MLIIKSVSELLSRVESLKSKGESIGLVPTMGALHEGHLSLVKKSKERDDVTIVSVFVNPIQFNNPQDLLTYPRTPEEDAQQLAKENVDILFMPTEEEMTAEAEVAAKTFRLGSVAEVMEGKFRPGHFQGVAYIVNRLFQLCRPTRAYFGMKDFQQIAVIR